MVARKPTSFDSNISVEHFSKRSSVYIDPESDLYAEIRYLQHIKKPKCISCLQLRKSSTFSLDFDDESEGMKLV